MQLCGKPRRPADVLLAACDATHMFICTWSREIRQTHKWSLEPSHLIPGSLSAEDQDIEESLFFFCVKEKTGWTR